MTRVRYRKRKKTPGDCAIPRTACNMPMTIRARALLIINSNRRLVTRYGVKELKRVPKSLSNFFFPLWRIFGQIARDRHLYFTSPHLCLLHLCKGKRGKRVRVRGSDKREFLILSFVSFLFLYWQAILAFVSLCRVFAKAMTVVEMRKRGEKGAGKGK